MNLTSSPVVYPESSSPVHQAPLPRKKRKLDHASTRAPLEPIFNDVPQGPKTLAGFVVDEDSDEEDWRGDKDQDTSFLPTTDPGLDPLSDDPQSPQAQLLAPLDSYLQACTANGRTLLIRERRKLPTTSFEQLVAARSVGSEGKARKEYYGIDIHRLVDEAAAKLKKQDSARTDPPRPPKSAGEENIATRPSHAPAQLWTEKYRARKFTDLIGDERTHRSVLRWLKAWDHIVFPGQSRPKTKSTDDQAGEKQHRKILLLSGPPGLGKTTLAHVCARQAGYETQEINASDERSREVVRGRIRDMVATENIRSVHSGVDGKSKGLAKPICVVVDEVDGVVSGGGGAGEGGFIKALIDLVSLDQKHSSLTSRDNAASMGKRRKGDNFRLLRPIILICNDLYHPSLRLLRQGSVAEIVYVRKPSLAMVVPRMQTIFEKEGVKCDSDGIRQLCEATWGMTSRREGGTRRGGNFEGDIRGILVMAEWVSNKLRHSHKSNVHAGATLTRRLIESHIIGDLAGDGSASKSLGRGGFKEVVERVFMNNAGFSTSIQSTRTSKQECSWIEKKGPSATEVSKKNALDRLQEMIINVGEDDRIMTDCFSTWPTHPFQDDTIFTKPTLAYDWLHFHGLLSHRLHTMQEWDLSQYLAYPVLAFHNLFASSSTVSNPSTEPNSVGRGDALLNPTYAAARAQELTRANVETLGSLHHTLSLPLQRSFRSQHTLVTELVPYALRLLRPDVKPVVVGSVASVRRGPERERVSRAVDTMCATGVTFERSRVEYGGKEGEDEGDKPVTTSRVPTDWIYRMDPPVDELGTFTTSTNKTSSSTSDGGKVRYAVRQVLEQEWKREIAKREAEARSRRAGGLTEADPDAESLTPDTNGPQSAKTKEKSLSDSANALKAKGVKKDFFGRPIMTEESNLDSRPSSQAGQNGERPSSGDDEAGRIWMTYHEGYSNAVKKGITLKELLEGL